MKQPKHLLKSSLQNNFEISLFYYEKGDRYD